MTDREAMKLALEALESSQESGSVGAFDCSMTVLPVGVPIGH